MEEKHLSFLVIHILTNLMISRILLWEYRTNDNSFNDILEKAIGEPAIREFLSLEFLRGKDGKDNFLQKSFPNNRNAICVTDAGFNLPNIGYSYSTGGNYKEKMCIL